MKVLFISNSYIGDAVLTTGVLNHLIERYPQARFTIVAGKAAAPLFAAVPRLDRVITVSKRTFGRHWLSIWLQCVTTRWEVVVDFRRSAIAFLLPARRRYVWFRRRMSDTAMVRSLAAVVRVDPPPAPTIWLAESDLTKARQMLPENGPILALGPIASWRGKRWPGERFAELAERLTRPAAPLAGAHIAVFGGPGEELSAASVLARLSHRQTLDLVGKLSLLEAAACLKRCSMYIGNDSGLMHIAAAVGIPTLGLFGPGRHGIYAPWGERAAYVRTPESASALLAKAAQGIDHGLMDGLTVDMAHAAACALFEGARREN